jgi:hypothetical protein
LDSAKVDVADQGTLRIPVDIVLDQDVVLEYRDLRKIVALPDDHLARHRFPPCEKLCLAQDGRAPPTCFPTFASALPLGLHSSRPVDAGDFIADVLAARLAYPDKSVRRVVRSRSGLLSPPTATTTPSALALSAGVSVASGFAGFVLLRLLCFIRLGLIARGAPPTTTSAATATFAALASLAVGRRLLGWLGQALLLRRSLLGSRFYGLGFFRRSCLRRRLLGCGFLICRFLRRKCPGRLLLRGDLDDDAGLGG